MIDRLRILKPGDTVSTIVGPGVSADVPIEAVVWLRGVEHFIVVTRDTPDPIYALRDRGNISEPINPPQR